MLAKALNRKVLAVAIVLVAAGATAFTVHAKYRRAVGLGTISLTGGTTYKVVNSGETHQQTASGSLTNNFGNGEAITDMGIIVRRKGAMGTQPQIGKTKITNGTEEDEQSAQQNGPNGSGKTHHDTDSFGSIGGQASANVTIEVNISSSADDTEFCFTPSVSDKPKNSDEAANTLAEFHMTESADLHRHSISALLHDRLAFYVRNEDIRFDIDQLDGTVTFPAGSSATITNVYLQDPSSSYSEPAGTLTSISGNTFSITGFTNLAEDDAYEVVVVFSQSFNAETVKILMEAGFDN